MTYRINKNHMSAQFASLSLTESYLPGAPMFPNHWATLGWSYTGAHGYTIQMRKARHVETPMLRLHEAPKKKPIRPIAADDLFQVPTLSTRVSNAPFCKAFLRFRWFRSLRSFRPSRYAMMLNLNFSSHLATKNHPYMSIQVHVHQSCAENLQLAALDLATGGFRKFLLLQGHHHTSG